MLILRGTGPSYREVPDGTPERDIIQNLHNDIQVRRYIGEPAMEASATTTSVIRYSVWKLLLTSIGAKEISCAPSRCAYHTMVTHGYRERPGAALTHRLQGLGRLYATHIDLLLVADLGAIILAASLNLPSDIFAQVTALTAQWSI
jgi:hypothetical protein